MFTVGEKSVYEKLLQEPSSIVFKEANGIVFLDKNTAKHYCETNVYSRNFAVFRIAETSNYYEKDGSFFLTSKTQIISSV